MAGILLAGRQEIDMRESDARLLAALEDPLQRLSLSLFCPRCHALGNPDGVQAKNHPGDATWTVTCGCTTRILRRFRG